MASLLLLLPVLCVFAFHVSLSLGTPILPQSPSASAEDEQHHSLWLGIRYRAHFKKTPIENKKTQQKE